MALIIVLKNANAIDPAKAGEKTATAAQHYGPSFETTIGKIIWIRTRFGNFWVWS